MLSGCGVLTMSTSKPAPSPTLNNLPSFYKANPAVPEQPAVYKLIDVCYSVVEWKHFTSSQNKYFKKGYELLGHCDFLESTGTPLCENAIDYGRYLGADVIIYSIQQTPDGESEHHISYLVAPFIFRILHTRILSDRTASRPTFMGSDAFLSLAKSLTAQRSKRS